MTRDASVPAPIGKEAGKRRGLSKPYVDAIMQATQGESIMEQQPNARMCFVGGIENPIGLDLGGRTSAETALSILAEIVAVKNGRTGCSLRDTAGRIGR